MEKQLFKVGRTPEGNAFELAFVVSAILVCVYVVLVYLQAPETVATHFGPSGMPDAYGHKSKMLIPCVVTFIVAVCMMVGAYFPHHINLPGIVTPNVRQVSLSIRMVRVLDILMLTLTAAVAHDTQRGHILMVFVVLAAMLMVCVVFICLIYKAK